MAEMWGAVEKMQLISDFSSTQAYVSQERLSIAIAQPLWRQQGSMQSLSQVWLAFSLASSFANNPGKERDVRVRMNK